MFVRAHINLFGVFMRNIEATNKAEHLIKRAVSLCGDIRRLAELTGISRGTLYRLANNRSGVTRATCLKIENFVSENSNRPGRPFQKKSNKKGNTHV